MNETLDLALSTGSLNSYIYRVNQIPLLSAEEERALAAKFREKGDLNAARQLVLSHLRFVVHVAQGYLGYGLALADLIQEGTVGLMKAVKRFIPERGVRLVTFAVHWIRAEIHEFILRNWRIVKIATTKAQRKLFFNLRKATKHLGWLNNKEATAVAKDLHVATSDVRDMESRFSNADLSFDATPDEDEENFTAPVNYLEDKSLNPETKLEAQNLHEHDHELLQKGLATLDERSRDILKNRWLKEENSATLQDLATKYQVSAERIRQLEQAALAKLRTYLSK